MGLGFWAKGLGCRCWAKGLGLGSGVQLGEGFGFGVWGVRFLLLLRVFGFNAAYVILKW